MSSHIIIIAGPTASGKSDLSYFLAKQLDGEIINADLGQFYEPLNIGTAKPNWQNQTIPSHLFDILSLPQNFTVHSYKNIVTDTVNSICARGKIPIVVGGSLFYIKSLLFPPREFVTPHYDHTQEDTTGYLDTLSNNQKWQLLCTIDPERSKHIHPNDNYRITRALFIWFSSNKKPSQCIPTFNPIFPFFLILILPPRETLINNINQRTINMLDGGWIEEARDLISKGWDNFINKKGFIGYSLLFSWIQSQMLLKDALISSIQNKTLKYAKKQIVFINKLVKNIQEEKQNNSCPFFLYFVSKCYNQDRPDTSDLIDAYKFFLRDRLTGKN